MATSMASRFFLSDLGKKVMGGVAITSGLGAFCLHYVPNTFLINYYLDVVRLYNKGASVPVSKTLLERFEKAKQYAEIPDNCVKLFKPFSVFGFNMFHAGSSYSKFGAYVGLPVNFSYYDPDLIDKYKIKIRGESVSWDLPEAKDFLQSLVLSENAQIYAMAREMKMLLTPKLYFDSIYATFAIACTYGMSRYINQKFNFYNKPRGLRVMLYGIVGMFMAVNYVMTNDSVQMYYEHKADEELKIKDPLLREGAKEFYEKLLARNIALRKLMGADGASMYTVLGNENYSFRQPHLPLVQRKEFFES